MKITEAELNAKIAELRGVKMSMVIECPAYSSDMNLAVELLRELPDGTLRYFYSMAHRKNRCRVEWDCGDNGIPGEVGEEAKTISLAWLQWKTGEVYEVIE